MKDVVRDALKMLRSQGIRIPRSFTKRLDKKHSFTLTRIDIKKFKDQISRLDGGGRLVVGISQKGTLTFHTFDGYKSMLKTAENARKFIGKENAHEKQAV